MIRPNITLVGTLRKALDREHLQSTFVEVARDANVDAGNLSKFLSGSRGLSALAVESLCVRLGVHIEWQHPKGVVRGKLLHVLREALLRSTNSLRAVGHHASIDPGNLSRFVRKERCGLTIANIESICRFFKIKIIWRGTLTVEVLRETKVGNVTVVPDALVECFCESPHIDLKLKSDRYGKAIFEEVPIGSNIEVRVNGVGQQLEMIDNSQVFSFVI